MELKWNKASESLPKKDKNYLVIVDAFGHKHADVYGFVRVGEKIDDSDLVGRRNIFYSFDSEYGCYECSDVLYWMEISQFPKD